MASSSAPVEEQAVEDHTSSVWKCAALGDLEHLQKLLEERPDAVNIADEEGHWPLQWAALNNRYPVLQYLLSVCSYLPSTPLLPLLHALAPVPALPQKLYLRFIQACSPLADQWAHTGWTELATGLFITATVKGAEVNAVDRSGATALHWAAVRCALPCLEELLRSGAHKEAGDEKGHTACHVAAQYGHTAVLYHLVLRWSCDYDAEDVDGRTPLHWAAFKGFHDIARLLLVLGSSPSRADREGCTPLHWAALKGNSEAATVLLQGSNESLLTMVDGTGSTAEELANEKHHRLLSLFLRSELDKRRAKARHRHWLIKAAISAQFAPVVWVVGLASVYTHARYVVYASALPPPLPWMRGWSIAAILFCTAAFVVLAMVNVSDPGFLAQTSVADAHALARAKDKKCDFKKSDVDGGAGAGDNEFRVLLVPNPREQLQSLDCPALWAGSWGQLCVTCKIVRPLRAKHDAYTNRCIERFDHFCPWVGNSIGKKNHHIFILFIVLFVGPILTGYVIAFQRLQQARLFHPRPRHAHAHSLADSALNYDILVIIAWMVLNVPLLCTLVGLAVAQIGQALQNMTTNEMTNWPRYKHFRNPDTGDFMNPFDKGWLNNLHEISFPGQYPTMPTALDIETIDKVLARESKKSKSCCASKGCSSCPADKMANKLDAAV